MRKFLYLLIFICNALFAGMQDVELLANSVEKKSNIIEAKGDVIVYSQKYFISANRALYDEKSGFLELFGDVNIVREKNEAVKSKYAKINLNSDDGEFNPFFTYDNRSDVWLECETATGDKDFYITKNAVVSSCNVQDPAWKIAFDEGKLDKETSVLKLKNVVFYIRSVPIFYFPYFVISTDTTRRTGLLIPKLGYGFSDGFFYAQPMYLALSHRWDLEFVPQIRTKRGRGAYLTGRFVDTPDSRGEITIGGFEDRKNYRRKENLKNKNHFGYEVKYKNSNLASHLIGKEFDDGLWVDFTYLNDVDYLNLKHDNQNSFDSLVTSRLNYYLSRDEDYLGVYAKYYIDTSKINNDDTLQELPTLHYHRFLDKLVFPNLLYSLDFKYHNYYRKVGVGAKQLEVDLPITFYTSIFDDFIHLSVSENIYATFVNYHDKPNKKNEKFTRNYHKFSAYTELAKPYENFYHTLRFGVDYIVPSWDNGKITEDFISTQIETEKLRANMTQYFYNNMGKKRIKHSIAQTYNFNVKSDNKKREEESFGFYYDTLYKYGDLEHDIELYLNDNVYLKNRLNYSHERAKFSKVQTSLHAKTNKISADLIHTYLNNKNSKNNSFLSATLDFNYDRHHTLFSGIDYDLEEERSKMWKVGLSVKEKCYNYTLSYKEETRPKLTSAGSGSVRKEGLYVSFEIYPIGGTDYDFSHESSL